MKSLRKRAAKLARKIKRRQSWRQKAHRLQKQLGKKIGHRLDGLVDALTGQIKSLHRDLLDVNRQIKALQNREGRTAYLKWLEGTVGMTEGSAGRIAEARDLGYDPSLPWCSIHVAYGLIHHGGFSRADLPANPAYSGAWLTWSKGKRVAYADAQPGDLLIFDWGDGGITDHVATFIGQGLKIGGNENDRVEKDAVPAGAIVAVIRPDWN